MRYDADHKQRTRARVLEQAARAIRQHGPDRVGVADIMQSAGLTHGGFYAHFESKEDLIANAIDQMFVESLDKFRLATEGKAAAEGLAIYISGYLSRAHRDGRESGCPLATISTDVSRMERAARDGFERGSAQLATEIAGKLTEIGAPNPGELALSVLAELVGALMIARAVADERRSTALLHSARKQLLDRLGLNERVCAH